MILTPLMPHQKRALDFLTLTDEPKGCFMFLGSGKSLVALACADKWEVKSILITSDRNNVLHTWPDQVWRHTDYCTVIRPKKLGDWDCDKVEFGTTGLITITNYDLLSEHHELYAGLHWDLWIGDESGYLKDQRTKRWRNVRRVVEHIPRKIILNAKPITERLEDLWPQIFLLDKGQRLGRNMTKFRLRFMQPSPDGFGWVPKRSALTRVQQHIADIAYFLEDDPSIKLPEIARHVVEVLPTQEQRDMDSRLKEAFELCLDRIDELKDPDYHEQRVEQYNYAVTVFQKRAQLVGGTVKTEGGVKYVPTRKLRALKRVLDDNPDEKIVVWHEYIAETGLLQEALGHIARPVLDVTHHTHVSEALEAFAMLDAPAVLLIRNSMARGLNQLAGAGIAVWYSNSTSYATRAQAEGRTRRITSTADVTHYVDLVVKGGADDLIHQHLTRKQGLSLSLPRLRAISECDIAEHEEGGENEE